MKLEDLDRIVPERLRRAVVEAGVEVEGEVDTVLVPAEGRLIASFQRLAGMLSAPAEVTEEEWQRLAAFGGLMFCIGATYAELSRTDAS